jgi:hypothetical protein
VSKPTPLKKNLVPRFESKRRSREVFPDRDVAHNVKLFWPDLGNRLFAVITFSCAEDLILLLGFGLLRVRAITYEIPELSTVVAKAEREFLRL